MARSRAKKDFIGFILAAEKDSKLTEDFLDFVSKKRAMELHNFFQKEGFTEVTQENCEAILRSRSLMFAIRRRPYPPLCPDDANY